MFFLSGLCRTGCSSFISAEPKIASGPQDGVTSACGMRPQALTLTSDTYRGGVSSDWMLISGPACCWLTAWPLLYQEADTIRGRGGPLTERSPILFHVFTACSKPWKHSQAQKKTHFIKPFVTEQTAEMWLINTWRHTVYKHWLNTFLLQRIYYVTNFK